MKVLDSTPDFWGFRHGKNVVLYKSHNWFGVCVVDYKTKSILKKIRFSSIDTAKQFFYTEMNNVSLNTQAEKNTASVEKQYEILFSQGELNSL